MLEWKFMTTLVYRGLTIGQNADFAIEELVY